MGQYPNSGILRRNDRRKTDKHPEFTGSAEVDDQEYWLAAWVNEKDGRKYFKLSFTKKDEYAQAPSDDGLQDGDIPF